MESEGLLREAFGLNSYEAKLYVALLGQSMKATEAARASGVPLSRTYDTLRSLEKKGFVRESDGAFGSTPPSSALGSRFAKYVSDFDSEQASRKSAMGKIVGELEPLASSGKGEAEPVMLRGLDSISAAFLEVLGSSDKVFLLVRRGFKMRAAFLDLISQSGAKAAAVKLMLPVDQKVTRSELREAVNLGLDIRYSDGVLLDMMAGDGSGVIIGVPARGSDESFAAVAIWVRSRSFAASVLETLQAQWKGARKLSGNL